MEQPQMEQKQGKLQGRPPGKDYPLPVMVYLNADGKRKLKGLAQQEGESLSAAVRRLIRLATK